MYFSYEPNRLERIYLLNTYETLVPVVKRFIEIQKTKVTDEQLAIVKTVGEKSS